MTPIAFEQRYRADWDELERLLKTLLGEAPPSPGGPAPDAMRARIAQLYRRGCEHLAIARERAYPAYLVERLDDLTHRAHQLIYRRADWGLHTLREVFMSRFPMQVRAHAGPLWVALAVFAGPLLAMGVLTWWHPPLILSLLDAHTVWSFGEMYGDAAQRIGRQAQTDWQMFGFYILNNISIAFQCFASGLFLGLGSVFFLAFNGALIGAIAGYLTHQGLGENFYAFVATHSSFELTAIVLSGAAGLRLGQAILAPGRRTRAHALMEAARGAVVLIYGVIALLLIAAAVEAFWSSSRWVPAPVKYGVGALCWGALLLYLLWPARAAARSRETS